MFSRRMLVVALSLVVVASCGAQSEPDTASAPWQLIDRQADGKFSFMVPADWVDLKTDENEAALLAAFPDGSVYETWSRVGGGTSATVTSIPLDAMGSYSVQDHRREILLHAADRGWEVESYEHTIISGLPAAHAATKAYTSDGDPVTVHSFMVIGAGRVHLVVTGMTDPSRYDHVIGEIIASYSIAE